MLVRLLMLLGKDWRVVLVWQSCPRIYQPSGWAGGWAYLDRFGLPKLPSSQRLSVCLVGGTTRPTGMPLVPVECSSATVLTNRCTPRHNVYKGCTNTLAILIRKGNQVALVEAAAWKL
jgi:hypothetical protein